MKSYLIPTTISIIFITLLIASTVGTSETSHFADIAKNISMFSLGAILVSLIWMIVNAINPGSCKAAEGKCAFSGEFEGDKNN